MHRIAVTRTALFAWLTVISLLLCQRGRAEPPRELHYFDIPPMMFTDGQGRAAGRLIERVRKAWPAELPLPPMVAAPLKRSVHDILDSGEPICLIGVFKTAEREAAAWFSSPIYRESPSVFVATRTAAAKMRRHESAQALIEDPGQRLLLTDGASYGPQLDAWLKRRGGGVLRVAAPPARQIHMLLRGHAEYMFSDMDQATQLLKDLGPAAAALEIVQLPGMAESPTRHLMCQRQLDRAWLEALDEGLKTIDLAPTLAP
ncbi:transporter substrate-binding domain-containing protein [Paucibacter sp. APW11]|uniref:Transporter substrate-binding domain-containing protein n=1 Tax=Roseateles aquae TaxID=3077235 RepID=A0ABU3P8M8_9BURK|nr:transporter substrate-binding domain-containing protein [Paucibacter sp. APW11]MDT8998647.1 transporter substrate-binding domain-containing protein [Paucibacter sp. APW11]